VLFSPWLGRGQCIEHYGAGEAYLPILEALGRLCRALDGKRLIALLHQHAPAWLVQMPALLKATELEALQRKTAGATKERMLRELAEAMEALTAERPLVLWLEDLHWSDVSTLDWLAFLARRPERARLLVIGTYRPVEVLMREHPLKAVKQELQVHGQCWELPLDFLRDEDVAEYLAVRFAVGARRAVPLQRLARAIHRRTDGNPLFMVNVVNHLLAQRVIAQVDGQWVVQGGEAEVARQVPEDLRQMIEQRLAQVEVAERTVLEVASVAGVEFSAASVAAGLETTVEAVEERCVELAWRESFLRVCGPAEWSDGTMATRYGFLHALYHKILYERLPAGRRQRLHQRIGEREEQAYGERAREIAAELAVHFEEGRDYQRAVRYLQHAGENAIQRSAHQEAISHLTKGLGLLKALPDTPERAQQELRLQIALGSLLGMTKGFAAPEVETAYVRARELCQQVGVTPQLFPILGGLWGFYALRAELQTAHGLAEQLLTLAQRMQAPALLVGAHCRLGIALFWLGELTPALEHLEQGVALYDPQHRHAYHAGPDPKVVCLSHAVGVLWLLGYPDHALQRSYEALTMAQELSHPFSLATALQMAAVLQLRCGTLQAVQERAEAMITLSTEQGFAVLLAQGTILRGWSLAEQGQREEGIAQIWQGLAVLRTTGTEVIRPYNLALLAEAYGGAGQTEEGLRVLAEALVIVDKTGERFYEAELYRLKGELTLQQFGVRSPEFGVPNPQHPTPSTQAEVEAEACFHKAIEIARRQQAKSLELRAVISLSRLWQRQGKRKEAWEILAEIYDWFTEGFDTKDWQEAKALLEELG
jgi:predicted ATPase